MWHELPKLTETISGKHLFDHFGFAFGDPAPFYGFDKQLITELWKKKTEEQGEEEEEKLAVSVADFVECPLLPLMDY